MTSHFTLTCHPTNTPCLLRWQSEKSLSREFFALFKYVGAVTELTFLALTRFPTAASPLVRQVEHLDVTPNVSAIRKTHPKFTKKRPNSLSRVPTQFSDASTRSNAISPDMPSSLSSLDAQTKGPPPPG